MTYKEIVDNIQAIVDAHKILADFGYGQISDIKTGGDDQEANYPYAFLNPQTHTRSERAINYRFNLIVMDMYLGDDFLSAQSQCQQYIDDILAEMKYGTQTYDIAINATLTPFKERFQDVVGGMTATIDIEVPQKLNLCVAPYVAAPLPPTGCQPTLPIFSENLLTLDYSGDPDNAAGAWRFDDALVQNTDIATWADLYTLNAIAGSYEFTVIQTLTFAEPAAGETFPPKPQLRGLSFPTHPDVESNCDSGNWPTVWTPDPITYTAQFRVTTTTPTSFTIVGFPSNPAEESGFTQIAGGILNIGFEGDIPVPVPVVIETTVLEFTQGATQQEVYNTNAAYNFESHTTDDTYLSQASYSNFTNNQFTSFEANLQFDGELLYQTLNGFNPANYQMAIYNSTSNEFLGMTDLPTNDGVVSLTSSTFTFPAGYGNYYLTFYEIGTPNPQDNPPGVLKPLKFSNSTFKINVIS
jgi:hypothetical protein